MSVPITTYVVAKPKKSSRAVVVSSNKNGFYVGLRARGYKGLELEARNTASNETVEIMK